MAKKLTRRMRVARWILGRIEDKLVRPRFWPTSWDQMTPEQKRRADWYDAKMELLNMLLSDAWWIEADISCRGCLTHHPEGYACHKCGREPEENEVQVLAEPKFYMVYPMAKRPADLEQAQSELDRAHEQLTRAQKTLAETREMAASLAIHHPEDHREWDTPQEAIDSDRAEEKMLAKDWQMN